MLIAPTGGKYWRLKYRFQSKEKLLAIGVYHVILLAEARERSVVMAISTEKNGVEWICGTDVEPKIMPWVWKGWLVAGKVHILGGSPGTGKTTIALSLAATMTRGSLWPDGTSSEPGNVLIWSSKDDIQDTLLPGLLAHSADPDRIYFMSKHNKAKVFDLMENMSQLDEEASKIGQLRFIIIDPIACSSSHNAHKKADFRRMLQSLVALGDQLDAVILGIYSFSQETLGDDPLERVIRSLAGSTLPRVVLVTVQEVYPDGKVKPVLLRVKSTYAPEGSGYYYNLKKIENPDHPAVFSSQIVWGNPIERNTVTLKK